MGKFRDVIYAKWNGGPSEDDYFKMYTSNLTGYGSARDAWMRTEDQWKEKTGVNRFNSYETFASSRSRLKLPDTKKKKRDPFESKFNWITGY